MSKSVVKIQEKVGMQEPSITRLISKKISYYEDKGKELESVDPVDPSCVFLTFDEVNE